MEWKPASQPPKGSIDKWTENVIAVTNYGDVFSLAYFTGKDGGHWQRPARFNDGEQVEWWIWSPPNNHIQSDAEKPCPVCGCNCGRGAYCPECGLKRTA